MALDVTVGGTWLTSLHGWGELKFSTIADGGSEEVSWRMDLAPSFTHPSFRMGKLVEIKAGPSNVWKGVLAEPDVSAEGWTFTAIGLADEATGYLCLDSGGNTTSTPDVAIDQAVARGLPWTRPASLSNVPFAVSNDTDNLNYLADLLDAWAQSQSKRWAVTPDGEVYAYSEPTEPSWFTSPGAVRLGLADDDYASNLYVRYKTSATSFATQAVSDATAAATRRREYPVDATSLGIIDSTKATAVGTGLLARGKARFAWTDAITVSRNQLTNAGGTPAFLPFVRAGQMVRSFSVVNEQGVTLPYVDWVIGKTEYVDGADTITLAPTTLAPRSLGDVLALAVS